MTQRVFIVNHTGVMGGAEVGLAEWLRFVDRERVDPLVAAPARGPLLGHLRAAGYRTLAQPMVRARRTRNPWRVTGMTLQGLCQMVSLSRIMVRERIQVVHANSNNAFMIAGPAARRRRIPAIWHVRDMTPLGWIGRRLYRRATVIVAVSEAVAKHVRRYQTGHDRVRVIANGIDGVRFRDSDAGRADTRRALFPRIDDRTVVIGMVGNLVPWKRHDLFLDVAATLLRETDDRFRFVIAGDDRFGDHPDYERSLRDRMAETPLHSRALMAGFRDDIPAFMGALDILVHPTGREPFGRVMVEAMAAGRPVVAVNGGGASEIVVDRETGFLTPPDDVSAMTDAVRSLAHDPAARRRLGAAGRERALRHFDARRVGRQLTDLYEELAREYPADRY